MKKREEKETLKKKFESWQSTLGLLQLIGILLSDYTKKKKKDNEEAHQWLVDNIYSKVPEIPE